MRSYDVDESESRLMIALNMAIQALQAQADGDLISRQGAIDAMTLSKINQNMDDLNDGDARKVKRSVQRTLAQLPTVAIPSATGHWKRISIDKYSEHAKYWYRCDKCGKDNLGNTDWCPNCGAKRIEPQERSEE